MEPNQVIELLAIAVTLFFFGLGSVFDLKNREVSDKLWLVYGPVGLTLTGSRIVIIPSAAFPIALSIVIATVVALGLFYLGLFGGADAKAVICLGLTIPLFPASYQPLLIYIHPFFPIMVVITGFLLSFSVAVWICFKNIYSYHVHGSRMFEGLTSEPIWKKAAAFVSGYPTEVSRLISTNYLYPIEEVVEDTNGARRTIRLFLNAEADRDEMVSRLTGLLPKVGSPNIVWVSPGLPLLVFFFIGIVVTLIAGDLLFSAVFLLMAG